MKAKVLSFVLAVTLMLCLVPALMAQSQYVSGSVVDASGAVVAGAKVTITDADKGTLAREVTTDEQGRFMALNIQPGKFKITVEKAGFKKTDSTFQLEINTKLDLGQVKLEVGEITAEVAVTGIMPTIQTNTMEKSFLVESTQIQQLPMNGRNWVSLMKTVPGVTSSSQDDFSMNFNDVSQFHASGGRGSQNNFYLDGSPNLDVGDNQSQYTQPSIDSIAEFKVQQSSFNAEYGRSSGMVVAVQTKSGASGFHGTAYDYLRNDSLDARYPSSMTKDILRYNNFGGNFSGWIPVPKISTKDNKKLFFFYNREMTRRNIQPAGQNFIDIPSAKTFVNGDFSPFITGGKDDWGNPVGVVYQPGTVKWDSAGNIIAGTPYPNDIVPTSAWYPKTANYLKLFTGIPGYSSLPAAPAPGMVRWTFSSPSRLRKDQDLLRIDYNLSNRTTTYFRWVNDYQIEYQSGAIWGWNSYGPQLPFAKQERPKPGSSWSWNIVNTLSPTLASETILSYNHQSQKLAASDTNGSRTGLGTDFTQLYPLSNPANYLSDVSAWGGRGFPGFYLSWGNPGWHNDGKDYAVTENLSWVKKSHTMKFGFFYNRDNKKQTATWPQQGTISFDNSNNNPGSTGSNLANLMLGNMSNYNQSALSVYPYFRFQSWEFYGQDSWKVSNKLTIEFGARFQRTTPTYTYTRDGEFGGEGTFPLYSVDLAKWSVATAPKINFATGNVLGDIYQGYLANGLICDPCSGVDRGFAPTKNFVAPRVGFAYDLFGDGKTAIRAGFGQFIERLRQNNFNFGAGNQFPNNGGYSANNIPASEITAGPPLSTTFASDTTRPQGYSTFPVGNTMPSIYSWNFGIQRDLGHSMTLDASYVGNRGTHLMVQRQINTTPAGFFDIPGYYSSVNGYTDGLRPYRGYGSLNSVETSGSSSYNALMLRLSRRFANRLSYNVNYTWSKTMDIVDNDSDNLVNPLNIAANWARAGYDATHSLTADFVYQLPELKSQNMFVRAVLGGWQVSGIFQAQSGFPFSVTSNGDLRCNDCGTQYVNLAADPYANLKAGQFFNPSAFTRPANGVYGSLGRNALRYPGWWNVDSDVAKNFKIHEKVNLKVACDFFNLFNHTQNWGFNTGWASDNQGGGPNASTVGNFGTVTSYKIARTLQFGFKLTF
jgi:hypothetical protein